MAVGDVGAFDPVAVCSELGSGYISESTSTSNALPFPFRRDISAISSDEAEADTFGFDRKNALND
jgi:hypothetical protein